MTSGSRLDADWLSAPLPRAVCAALEAAGRRALFVGGCVRNALLDRPVTDIDLATDASPQEVMRLVAAAGLRAEPTGLAHGTVTVIGDGGAVEVTTFRRDVSTDGRRAVVAFTADLAEDAARRDFTMNALYARPDGTLVDPLGGLPDLRAGRVRFVGDPGARIAEDYLRILRFFRFTAWYGDPAVGLDAPGLAACASAVDGLSRLSRERIGAETIKLLAAPDPAAAVAAMAGIGALSRVLPGADPRPLAPLVRVETAQGCAPSWERRLAVLGQDTSWPGRLRLPKAGARAYEAICKALASGDSPAAAAYRVGVPAARAAALVAAARGVAPLPVALEAELARGGTAILPVRAADLPLTGPALGRALRRIEGDWIASDFALDKDALLAREAAAGG